MASLSVVPARHSLYDHISDVEAIADTLESLDDDALTPEAYDDLSRRLIDAIAGTRDKVDRTAAALASFEHAASAAASEIDRLTARKKSFERSHARLTDYVLAVLDASKLKAIDGHTSRLAIRANPAGVRIDDPREIPADYMRSLPIPEDVPDKAAIKAALQAGRAVAGCALVAGRRLVRS